MREIALDTETTGLDPATGHRIVELGCVEMHNRIRTGNTWHSYLNPERDMPQEAFAVHGLSSVFLSNKPLFSSVASAFLDFIGDSTLVIHNAQFDMKFINAELVKSGLAAIPFERAIDTVGMARRKFPGAPAKLDALCKRFNIDSSARVKHGALLDAELLADVYLELMGGRQEAMLLATETAEEAAAPQTTGLNTIPCRTFPASEQELAAHSEFVRTLKNPLWLAETA
jgi:DNA polymerase III subunit epsilon